MSERRRSAAGVLSSALALARSPRWGLRSSAPVERVTFQDAVKRALERHPTVGQAVQAIRRAQALLDQSRAVFQPLVTGLVERDDPRRRARL